MLRVFNQQNFYGLSNIDIRDQHTRLYQWAYVLFESKEKKFFDIPGGDHRPQKIFFELLQNGPIKYDQDPYLTPFQ